MSNSGVFQSKRSACIMGRSHGISTVAICSLVEARQKEQTIFIVCEILFVLLLSSADSTESSLSLLKLPKSHTLLGCIVRALKLNLKLGFLIGSPNGEDNQGNSGIFLACYGCRVYSRPSK